ncbi:MAG: GtrA family protein, partial [Myxococcales bacterium]
RHFVYRHRKPIGPGGGFVNYAAVNLTSFVFPVTCLWITRNVFEWESAVSDNISGNIVGSIIATIFRFWAFRRYVFKVEPPIFRRPLGPNPHVAHAARSGLGAPEVGPHEPEFLEHQPQQRQADPHHVVRVSGDARHERATEAVEGEGTGDVQRLS